MKTTILKKLKHLLPLTALPIILLVCWGLIVNLSAVRATHISPAEIGVWDLRDFDFENENALLTGGVQIPLIPEALLTPAEFAAREDEIIFVNPYIGTPGRQFATSRFRLLLPDYGYYTFSRMSTHFTDRIFVNGEWLQDVGVPADNRYEEVARRTRVTFTARPIYDDGYFAIEIVQQNSNFFHRVKGTPHGWYIGRDGFAETVMRVDYTFNVMMGFYLAMALIFFILFLLLHRQCHNLYFALFCLMWFLRTGVTEANVLAVLTPWLTGSMMLRIEYIAIPVAATLTIVIINGLFQGILHKYFCVGIYALSVAWTVLFLLGTPMFISHAVLYCMYMYAVGILFMVVCFIIKLRRLDMSQGIFLAGALFFLYITLLDFGILPSIIHLNMTVQVAMIAFAFCMATAVFMTTVREAEEAKANEQKAAADNIALETLSHMKTEYLANMSHEIKTPLTVISGNIQRSVSIINELGIEDETLNRSLTKAKDEIMRMARITETALRMAAMQENREKMSPLDAAALFTTCAEAYRSIIEKRGNALIVTAQKSLPRVSGSADSLIQVLTNLLTNAKNHTKNGSVALHIGKKDDAFISVTVADTGAGIPPELLPHIFERGVTGGDGTGMGLAICKDIISFHGGEIEIHNRENGAGVIAAFTIPIHMEEKETERDA